MESANRLLKSTDLVTMNTDFYPTLLELAGLPLEPEHHIDAKFPRRGDASDPWHPDEAGLLP